MALLLGPLMLIVSLAICGAIGYEMFRRGYNGNRILEGLKGIGLCALTLVYATLLAAAIGAIGMGINEGLTYWQSCRKASRP